MPEARQCVFVTELEQLWKVMKDLAPKKLKLMMPSDYINYCWLQNIEMMQDVHEEIEQEPNNQAKELAPHFDPVTDDEPLEEEKVK